MGRAAVVSVSSRKKALLGALVVAGIVLSLGAYADSYARHGLTGRWYLFRQGRLERVVTTVEHRTFFPNRLRPAARYVENWDLERWPELPSGFPPLNARLKGFIDVPPGPHRWIELISPNDSFLLVNDQPVNRLPPGRHRVEIGWSGNMQPRADLEMRWGTRSGLLERVPDSAFTPQYPWPQLRVGVWVVTGLLMLFFGMGAYLILRAPSARKRWRRLRFMIAASIILLGLGYRLYDYQILPEFSANHDGLFVMWNGWSLLEDGSSRGWTIWGDFYEEQGAELEEMYYFERNKMVLVSPYLEHPPLYHLLVGAAVQAAGATHWLDTHLKHARLVSIGLQAIAILLVFLIGRRLVPRGATGYLGALMYAVMPNIVIQSRSVKEEALLTPLALAAVWLFLRYRDLSFRRRELILAAVCAGLCPLTKMPGLAIMGALWVLVLAERRYWDLLISAVVSLAVASLVLVYAGIVDWDLFWEVQRVQGTARGSNWNILFRFITFGKIDHNAVGLGWLLFMWVSWGIATARRPRDIALPVIVPTIAYVVAMGVAAGTWTFGWYMLPIYPFLCIGVGMFLNDFLQKPNLVHAFLFVSLALMYTFNYFAPVDLVTFYEETDSMFRATVFAFLVVAFGPFVILHVFPSSTTRRVCRWVGIAGIVAFVFFSGKYVYEFEQTYERYHHFDNKARAYRT